MVQITYTIQGEYLLPNLLPPEPPKAPLGKYASLHSHHLKENRKVTFMNLLTSGKLNPYLEEVDQQANEMMEDLVKKMAKEQGVTEKMKAENQMLWVGLMNNIRAAAEEVVLKELIYS